MACGQRLWLETRRKEEQKIHAQLNSTQLTSLAFIVVSLVLRVVVDVARVCCAPRPLLLGNLYTLLVVC